MLDMHCQAILDEFNEKRASFEKMKEIVLSSISDSIKNAGMLVTAIEGRVKEAKSLEGKLELKGFKYKDMYAITDLLGARVVTFYAADVDKVASMVENLFDIDWEESVDKRKILSSDQFGYLSLHYICRIPKKLYFDEAHPEINEIRFEIQMRTALQHVWATAFHDTGYKSDIEVPKEYIRALNRLAGMLEIADGQFGSIIDDIASYRRRVAEFLKAGKFEDLALDGDTFSGYMALDMFKSLNDKIAAINHAEISPANSSPYLEVCKMVGCNTIADIEKMRKECSDDAYKLAAHQLGNTDLEIISSNIGIQNVCIIQIARHGGGEYDFRIFYDTIFGEREKNTGSAKRIIEQLKVLGLIE